LLNNEFYGTAWIGGDSDFGTVFKINIDGTGFTNLHSFTGTSDGANPYAGLVSSGSRLFGTTSSGGSSNNGTVFAMNTDGTGFTNLHSFTALDGANSRARLVLAGGTLYGAAPNGGGSGNGTLFAISTNGTGFTNLYNFSALDPTTQTNTDGALPYTGFILSGNRLYGTALQGGNSGFGTVFSIFTNGMGFTNLYSFTARDPSTWINSDGAYPYANLILSGNVLYGTAQQGGSSGFGTIFAVNTDGTGFTNLYSFSNANSFFNFDGGLPSADLVLAGSTLYGTTSIGGNAAGGTVFALSLVPSLRIARAGNQVVLSWPEWAPNYLVQTTTNLGFGVWSGGVGVTNTVGNNFVFTNSVSGTSAFFRIYSP
jgi:uncharacterized repeat protein (TIGR03803 family)